MCFEPATSPFTANCTVASPRPWIPKLHTVTRIPDCLPDETSVRSIPTAVTAMFSSLPTEAGDSAMTCGRCRVPTAAFLGPRNLSRKSSQRTLSSSCQPSFRPSVTNTNSAPGFMCRFNWLSPASRSAGISVAVYDGFRPRR